MLTLSTQKPSLMAVGAHADDIENECGGTLLKAREAGYEIIYVMSTNNMSGSVSSLDENGQRHTREEECSAMMARRKRECAAAAAELGTEPIHLDHPQRHYTNAALERVKLQYGAPLPGAAPTSVPTIVTAYEDRESVGRLTALILKHRPELILTHSLTPYNVEHWCTAMLVVTAFWPAVEAGHRGGLLFWKENFTKFGLAAARWHTFVDTSPYLDRKMALIGKHACQMPNAHLPDFGHRILSQEWGKANGCLAAECYDWCRKPDVPQDDGSPVFGSITNELLRRTS